MALSAGEQYILHHFQLFYRLKKNSTIQYNPKSPKPDPKLQVKNEHNPMLNILQWTNVNIAHSNINNIFDDDTRTNNNLSISYHIQIHSTIFRHTLLGSWEIPHAREKCGVSSYSMWQNVLFIGAVTIWTVLLCMCVLSLPDNLIQMSSVRITSGQNLQRCRWTSWNPPNIANLCMTRFQYIFQRM